MAAQTRTYTGPLARGRVILPTREASFVRGEPVDVDDAEAALLDADPEWATPSKTKSPKAAAADTPKES